MSKQGKGRPQGAERIHICISLPVQLNNEIHQTAQERGMTISSFLELSARNSLHPAAAKPMKAPRPLRARGYDRFREHMRRRIKGAGGRLALTAKDIKGELSSAGILYRPSQLDAYLLKLAADELLEFRVEFSNYVFETVEWQMQKRSDDVKRELEARQKAYAEVEQTEEKTEAKQTPEAPKQTKEAEPTKEDLEAHQRYLDLAAKSEADDDQRRREAQDKKDNEQEIRFRKRVLGL